MITEKVYREKHNIEGVYWDPCPMIDLFKGDIFKYYTPDMQLIKDKHGYNVFKAIEDSTIGKAHGGVSISVVGLRRDGQEGGQCTNLLRT